MSASRDDLREQLAAYLRVHATAAASVLAYEPHDLGTASPLIVLSSGGSVRTRKTLQGSQLTATIYVDIYTVAAEATNGVATDAATADVMDLVESQVAAAVDAHQTHATGWIALEYGGASTIEFGIFNDDATPRFRERIPLAVTVVG